MKKAFVRNLFVLTAVFVSTCYGSCVLDEECVTKDGLKGVGTVLSSCKALKYIGATKKFVHDNKCERHYVVCCPLKFISKKICQNFGSRPEKPVITEYNVINGVEAEISEFPHFAALQYFEDVEESFNCAGVLISKNFVLTAAHCVSKKSNLPFSVRLGRTCLNSSDDSKDPFHSTDVKIKNITIHPEYVNRVKNFDIALVELDQPVNFTYNIFPACLNTEDREKEEILLISGFGVTNMQNKSKSMDMLKGNVSEVINSNCQTKFSNYINRDIFTLNEKVLCAHSDKFDTCQGDSGSGAMKLLNGKFYVVGITSFGMSCGNPIIPSIYTRVSSYIDWIENIVWP